MKSEAGRGKREVRGGAEGEIIHDEANAIVSLLGSYGIGATDLSDLQTKTDAFTGVLAAPGTAITERKGATDEIGKLLRKTDVILNNKIDKLMEKLKGTSPEFYRLYFDARIIVDTGIRHKVVGEISEEKKVA